MRKIMNKKLLCLLLSFIMVLSVCLAGCSKVTEEEADENMSEAASASAMTLAMYLMSEKPVSAETAAKIEAAVNNITETKYKTRMKLFFYTEEEYYTKLEESFAARDAAAANGTLLVPEVSTDGEQDTYVTDDGIVEIKYPTIAGYQVDIFYLGGVAKFNEYLTAGRLSRLDAELQSSSKKLNQFIPNEYFSALSALSKSTYAIPTNKAIGEYTYLLLSKKALNDAFRKSEGIDSLTGEECQDFLQFIANSNALKSKYIPLWTNLSTEELLATNLQFWGADADGNLTDSFSVLGGYYKNSDKYLDTNAYAEIANLFENKDFIENLKVLKEYEVNGYYGTDADLNAGKTFAVGCIKGGADLVEVYGDEYEMIVLETPRLDADTLYDDLFAVSSYTSSLSRSMTILTHLNTDAELRNLLLYGIEGEHYQVVDTGVKKNEYGETYKVVERLKEDYMMSLNKTGNTLLPYPESDKDVVPYINEYYVEQNRDADVRLSLGFTLNYDSAFKINLETLSQVRELSVAIYNEYNACDTMEKFDAFLIKAKADIEASEAVQMHLDFDHGIDEEASKDLAEDAEPIEKACDKSCGSLTCLYQLWLVEKGIVKAK